MWRRLHRTLGVCLTAGVVGLSSTLAGPPPQATSTTNAEAMKAELACLADPKAFPLSLQFVTTAQGVELRGQVPDEATRQHVLRLARQACYAVIHDRLTLIERCADPTLREAARVTLARYLQHRDAQVQVQVLEKGVVTLTGQVDTLEDKLIASRCLRQVAGCQRVVNNLEVKHAPAPAPTSSQKGVQQAANVPVSLPATAVRTVQASGGQDTLPEAPKKDMPPKETEKNPPKVPDPRVYPAEAEGLLVPVAPNPTLPLQPLVLPSRVRLQYHPLEPNARPLVQSAVQGYATTSPLKPCGLPGYPGCEPALQQGAVQFSVARVSPPPTLLGQLRSLIRGPRPERFDPEPVVAVPAVPEYRVMGNAGQPPVFQSNRITSRKVSPPAAVPASATVPAPSAVPASAAVSPPVATSASLPPPAVTVPASAPEHWPAAHNSQSADRLGSTPTPPAASTTKPVAASTTKPAVASSSSYQPTATTSVVAPPRREVTREITSEQMRQILLRGCGKHCRDVKVTTRPDGQPVFNIYAPVRAEQEVTHALLSIPEVVASNAHIQIHLEP